jgi:DNA-binding response OmpR family regulator
MQPPGAPSVLFLSAFRDESEMYGEYLRVVGFCVRIVTDAQAALNAAQRDPPDLIVVRVRYSTATADGIAVIARLKASASMRHVPAIVLTTFGAATERAAAAQAGCDSVLLLPTFPEELAAEIRRLLNEQQTLRPTSA